MKYHIYKRQFSFLIFLRFAMIQYSSFIISLFFFYFQILHTGVTYSDIVLIEYISKFIICFNISWTSQRQYLPPFSESIHESIDELNVALHFLFFNLTVKCSFNLLTLYTVSELFNNKYIYRWWSDKYVLKWRTFW